MRALPSLPTPQSPLSHANDGAKTEGLAEVPKERAPSPIPLLREHALVTAQSQLDALDQRHKDITQKTWRSHLYNIVEPSLQMAVGIAANLATQKIMAYAGEVAETVLSPSTIASAPLSPAMLASFVGASTISGQVAETLVEKVLGRKEDRSNPEWRAYLMTQKLTSHVIRDSQQQVALLPAEAKEAVRRFDDDALKRNVSERLENLQQRQAILLAWPQTIIDISHQHRWGDPVRRRSIESALRDLMSDYPESVSAGLRALTDTMRSNCYVKTPKRIQAYLYGAPGTGKTRFVKRLVSALGIPMYTVVAKTNRPDALLSAMEGPAFANSRDSSAKFTLASTIGDINFSFFKTGCLNPVIYVDEAGELFGEDGYASALKKLLDPESTTRQLISFPGTSIDISRATLLFAGNKPIADAALRSRMVQLQFGALGEDIKRGLLQKEIDAIGADHSVLPFAENEKLCAIMQQSRDIIIRIDAEFKVEGARDIKSCARALTSIVRDSVFSDRIWLPKDTETFVREFYSMQAPASH